MHEAKMTTYAKSLPGPIEVDGLLNAHRYALIVSAQLRQLAAQREKVGVEIDDVHFTEWQSQFLDPGDREVGFVSLGRLTQGQHSVLVFVKRKVDADRLARLVARSGVSFSGQARTTFAPVRASNGA